MAGGRVDETEVQKLNWLVFLIVILSWEEKLKIMLVV